MPVSKVFQVVNIIAFQEGKELVHVPGGQFHGFGGVAQGFQPKGKALGELQKLPAFKFPINTFLEHGTLRGYDRWDGLCSVPSGVPEGWDAKLFI